MKSLCNELSLTVFISDLDEVIITKNSMVIRHKTVKNPPKCFTTLHYFEFELSLEDSYLYQRYIRCLCTMQSRDFFLKSNPFLKILQSELLIKDICYCTRVSI